MDDSEAMFGLSGEGLCDGFVTSAMVHPGGVCWCVCMCVSCVRACAYKCA